MSRRNRVPFDDRVAKAAERALAARNLVRAIPCVAQDVEKARGDPSHLVPNRLLRVEKMRVGS
jgi:hypothetical protein